MDILESERALEIFSTVAEEGKTLSRIAKELKLSKQTCSDYLNALHRAGLIDKIKKGRDLFYFPNWKNVKKYFFDPVEEVFGQEEVFFKRVKSRGAKVRKSDFQKIKEIYEKRFTEEFFKAFFSGFAAYQEIFPCFVRNLKGVILNFWKSFYVINIREKGDPEIRKLKKLFGEKEYSLIVALSELFFILDVDREVVSLLSVPALMEIEKEGKEREEIS